MASKKGGVILVEIVMAEGSQTPTFSGRQVIRAILDDCIYNV
ncbi:MAG: hypothetical protein NTX57_11310 [Armatimonadetes bacterium]|nr:hypothetical protein [Armatimonadota bacterium]